MQTTHLLLYWQYVVELFCLERIKAQIDGDETTLCGDDLSRTALRHLADVRGELSTNFGWIY